MSTAVSALSTFHRITATVAMVLAMAAGMAIALDNDLKIQRHMLRSDGIAGIVLHLADLELDAHLAKTAVRMFGAHFTMTALFILLNSARVLNCILLGLLTMLVMLLGYAKIDADGALSFPMSTKPGGPEVSAISGALLIAACTGGVGLML